MYMPRSSVHALPILHHCGHEQQYFQSFSSTSGNWFAASSPFSINSPFSFWTTFSPLSLLASRPLTRFCTWVSATSLPLKRLTEGVDVTEVYLKKTLQGQQGSSPSARIRKVATSSGELTETERLGFRLPKQVSIP